MSPLLPPVGDPELTVRMPNPLLLVAMARTPAMLVTLVPSVLTVLTLIIPPLTSMLVPSGRTMPARLLVAVLMLAVITPSVTSMLVPSACSTPTLLLVPVGTLITPAVSASMVSPSVMTAPKKLLVAGCSSLPRTVLRTF